MPLKMFILLKDMQNTIDLTYSGSQQQIKLVLFNLYSTMVLVGNKHQCKRIEKNIYLYIIQTNGNLK